MIIGVAATFLLPLAAKALCERAHMPGLLGPLCVGVLAGPHGLALLDAQALQVAPAVSTCTLTVLLLRAGLGIDSAQLRRIGRPALAMSALPCLCEGLGVMAFSRAALHLSWAEAGMLGFVLAAATPAVIVPMMLRLSQGGWGRRKSIPSIVLAGASADDVFAITLFSVFIGLSARDASAAWQIAPMPLRLAGSVILGIGAGVLLHSLFTHIRLAHSRHFDWDCRSAWRWACSPSLRAWVWPGIWA